MSELSRVWRPDDLIYREELNHEVLYYIFQAAYMMPEAHILKTGSKDVRSSADIDQITVLGRGQESVDYDVKILETNNVISFFRDFEFREHLNRSEKLEIINRLNLTKVMVRFLVNDGEDNTRSGIVIYDLPIGEGITTLQILNCAERFQMIVDCLADQEDNVLVPFTGYGNRDSAENEIGTSALRRCIGW